MRKPLILVIAAMPPPLHGQSAVTANVVSMLIQSSCRTILANTSPERLERSLAYHTARIRKVAIAILRLLGSSPQGPKRMYTIVESGAGIAYNLITVLLCRLLGYEVFLHHHTAHHIAHKNRLVALLALVAGRRAMHIVLSDHMVADLRSRYPAIKRTCTLHNARNVVPCTRTHGAATHQLRIGFLANLSSEKGLDTAVATCLAAADAALDVKLILAGPIADSAARSTITRIRSEPRLFEYRGAIHGDAKQQFFESLDLFLFPTQYAHEAQPLVILEAMASRVPVIASNRGYIAELMGDCGVVVPANADFPSIAVATLKQWNMDRTELHAVGERCRARFDRFIQISERQFRMLLTTIGANPAQDGGDHGQA
jgi:glycosyltransferase involved in cell wall biosynthesis